MDSVNLIGKNTKLFMMECALYGFSKFYEIQLSTGKKMEIMLQIAIERAFSTIALIGNEFKDSKGIFKFDYYVGMLPEHYHGLLHGIAKGVDTLDNTINCIIMDIHARNDLNFMKKTRFSVGGIHFDPEKHTLDIPFEYEPKIIIKKLFQLSSYCENHGNIDIFAIQLKSF